MRAEGALERARKRAEITSLSDLNRGKVKQLLADAEHNIRLVKLGHGVHNVNYATALLNAAVQWCNEVDRIAGGTAARDGP